MKISWNELEALHVDWLDFCKLTGTNEWARNEGTLSREEEISLSIEDFIILTDDDSSVFRYI